MVDPQAAATDSQKSGLIRPLFEGLLDIIGDVHGEFGALKSLLARLGYDLDGRHPQGRRLVFVGDLCDRGPDSPEVVRCVRRWVEAGRAQCVLGNHELNLLRNEKKHGNHWFHPGDHKEHEGEFGKCAAAAPEEACEFAGFFDTLPLALERADLRIVHAAWCGQRLELLRSRVDRARAVYLGYEEWQQTEEGLRLRAASEAEKERHAAALSNRRVRPPMLEAVATYDVEYQMRNPVRVISSGVERRAEQPFYASGRWRFTDRVAWWRDYQDRVPVVFGHYWRWAQPEPPEHLGKDGSDLFRGDSPFAWHRNQAGEPVAFCVDYSVGARYQERKLPHRKRSGFVTRLAALRWPECRLVFDEGDEQQTSGAPAPR